MLVSTNLDLNQVHLQLPALSCKVIVFMLMILTMLYWKRLKGLPDGINACDCWRSSSVNWRVTTFLLFTSSEARQMIFCASHSMW